MCRLSRLSQTKELEVCSHTRESYQRAQKWKGWGDAGRALTVSAKWCILEGSWHLISGWILAELSNL